MEYLAKVASSVLFVTELERSVSFYRDLFGGEVSLRAEGEAALLLTPGGFQLYIIERGRHAQHHPGGLGHHLLMWTTDSPEGLKFFEQALKDSGSYTGTHSADQVTFVEGRDPDGIRVVVVHPDPAHGALSVFDSHLYT